MAQPILLNNLLGIKQLSNLKVRFNMQANGCWNPIDLLLHNTPFWKISTVMAVMWISYRVKVSGRTDYTRENIRLQ